VLRTKEVCSQLSEYLRQDKSVFIHCRQGIGRSSIVAAVILVSTGKTIDEALKRISEARNISVPETSEQKQWLKTHFGAG
jgi:protein-tyrosine phosphatase